MDGFPAASAAFVSGTIGVTGASGAETIGARSSTRAERGTIVDLGMLRSLAAQGGLFHLPEQIAEGGTSHIRDLAVT